MRSGLLPLYLLPLPGELLFSGFHEFREFLGPRIGIRVINAIGLIGHESFPAGFNLSSESIPDCWLFSLPLHSLFSFLDLDLIC